MVFCRGELLWEIDEVLGLDTVGAGFWAEFGEAAAGASGLYGQADAV